MEMLVIFKGRGGNGKGERVFHVLNMAGGRLEVDYVRKLSCLTLLPPHFLICIARNNAKHHHHVLEGYPTLRAVLHPFRTHTL